MHCDKSGEWVNMFNERLIGDENVNYRQNIMQNLIHPVNC